MILKIDLVPKPCWYKNVRSQVSPTTWFTLIQMVSSRANYRCEICGGQGTEWPVECQEIWYRFIVDPNKDETVWTQKLAGFRAICPSCHLVVHYGRAKIIGKTEEAKKQLQKVNNITKIRAQQHIQNAFSLWNQYNKFSWQIDLSYLNTIGIKYTPIVV